MRGTCGECQRLAVCRLKGNWQKAEGLPGCTRWHPVGTIRVENEKDVSGDGISGASVRGWVRYEDRFEGL